MTIQDILKQKLEYYTEHHAYEGDELDSTSFCESVEEYIKNLLKGYGTYILQNYTITPRGWQNKQNDKILSKVDVIDEFLKSIKQL